MTRTPPWPRAPTRRKGLGRSARRRPAISTVPSGQHARSCRAGWAGPAGWASPTPATRPAEGDRDRHRARARVARQRDEGGERDGRRCQRSRRPGGVDATAGTRRGARAPRLDGRVGSARVRRGWAPGSGTSDTARILPSPTGEGGQHLQDGPAEPRRCRGWRGPPVEQQGAHRGRSRSRRDGARSTAATASPTVGQPSSASSSTPAAARAPAQYADRDRRARPAHRPAYPAPRPTGGRHIVRQRSHHVFSRAWPPPAPYPSWAWPVCCC